MAAFRTQEEYMSHLLSGLRIKDEEIEAVKSENARLKVSLFDAIKEITKCCDTCGRNSFCQCRKQCYENDTNLWIWRGFGLDYD